MLPTDSSAKALLERTEEDPDAVTIDEIVEQLFECSAAGRFTVLRALTVATEDRPERASEAVERLERLVDVEQINDRQLAILGLKILARDHPDQVRSTVPTLVSVIESDDPGFVRAKAAEALATLAETDPGAVRPAVDSIVDLFGDDNLLLRDAGADVLKAMVPDEIDAVLPHAPALIDSLDSYPIPGAGADTRPGAPARDKLLEKRGEQQRKHGRWRTKTARVLATIALERPDPFVEHVPTIVAIIEDDHWIRTHRALLDVVGVAAELDPTAAVEAIGPAAELFEVNDRIVHAKVAWVLGLAADVAPEEVAEVTVPAVERLVTLLESDEPRKQGAAAGLLAYVAEYEPEAVQPTLPGLRSLLDADEPHLRGSAVWAIAFGGGESDVDRLRSLAADDPDSDVREAAADAADVLADRVE